MGKIVKGIVNFASSFAVMGLVVLALYSKDVWPRGTSRMQVN